jgi:pyridoxine kinase
VAHGSVGLAAICPALARLGHECIALPTILLSSHPGRPPFAGRIVEPETLRHMLEALDAGGQLDDVEAVLTGYMPSPAHAALAQDAVTRIRTRPAGALIVVDPIIGDDPKGLYVDRTVASAIRDQLLPVADIATPNTFELAWLSGVAVDSVASAIAAAARLAVPATLATSVPVPPHRLANVLVEPDGAHAVSVPRLEDAPHGTGDLLSALLVAARLEGRSNAEAMALAAAGVAAAVAASQGCDDLRLVASQQAWANAAPIALEPI